MAAGSGTLRSPRSRPRRTAVPTHPFWCSSTLCKWPPARGWAAALGEMVAAGQSIPGSQSSHSTRTYPPTFASLRGRRGCNSPPVPAAASGTTTSVGWTRRCSQPSHSWRPTNRRKPSFCHQQTRIFCGCGRQRQRQIRKRAGTPVANNTGPAIGVVPAFSIPHRPFRRDDRPQSLFD